MKKIITVSDNAIKQIKQIISSSNQDVDGVVVGIDKSGCSGYSYKLDYAKASEIGNFDFVEKDGVKVYIDPKAIVFLIGSEMDYTTDKLSSRFIFNNPNEKSSCGCGESFSI